MILVLQDLQLSATLQWRFVLKFSSNLQETTEGALRNGPRNPISLPYLVSNLEVLRAWPRKMQLEVYSDIFWKKWPMANECPFMVEIGRLLSVHTSHAVICFLFCFVWHVELGSSFRRCLCPSRKAEKVATGLKWILSNFAKYSHGCQVWSASLDTTGTKITALCPRPQACLARSAMGCAMGKYGHSFI